MGLLVNGVGLLNLGHSAKICFTGYFSPCTKYVQYYISEVRRAIVIDIPR